MKLIIGLLLFLSADIYYTSAETVRRVAKRELQPLMFMVTDEAGFPLADVEITWVYTDPSGARRSGTLESWVGGRKVKQKTTDRVQNVNQFEFNSPWGAPAIYTYDGGEVIFSFRKPGYQQKNRTFTVPFRQGLSSGGSMPLHMNVTMRELGTPIRIRP